MALNKTALTAAIKQAFQDEMPEPTSDQLDAYDRVATKLADAFEIYVKSGQVTVAAGISVSTTGTAAAQTGLTTSTGVGSIS